MYKVGFIGAGNMGSALARAAINSGADVYIYDKDEKKANAVAAELGAKFASNKKIALTCDYVFLAVKPDIIPIAIAEIADSFRENGSATLISMAAGVSIEKIEGSIKDAPIIRIMPNTPASVGEGLILWTANAQVTDSAILGFESVLSQAGSIVRIDEKKIDAASAVSGCGPAFVYMFIEALADGGVECGLTRKQAQKFAAQTVLGAAKTVLETGKHPGELKDAVCSPGGSTISGVAALEDGAFRATAASAVRAAYQKTLKLGK